MIYAPRENYTTELRQKWQGDPGARGFNGTGSEFNVHLSESVPGPHPDHRPHPARSRSRPSTCARSSSAWWPPARRWDDDLKTALIETTGEARGNDLLRRFGAAFPAGYRDEFAARARRCTTSS